MPERIALLWHNLAMPLGWIAGLSTTVGMLTGDGIAVAITVVGMSLVVTLGRLTPAIADAVRQIGTAYAEVRGKLKADMAGVKVGLAENRVGLAENREAIEDLRHQAAHDVAQARRDAEAARLEAARLRAEAVEEARKIKSEALAQAVAEAKRIERDAAEKRHLLRDQVAAQLMHARVEIEELKLKLGITDSTHVDAINTVADSVQVIADHMDPPVVVPPVRLQPGAGVEVAE